MLAVVRTSARQDALDVDCLGLVVELNEYAPVADAQPGLERPVSLRRLPL